MYLRDRNPKLIRRAKHIYLWTISALLFVSALMLLLSWILGEAISVLWYAVALIVCACLFSPVLDPNIYGQIAIAAIASVLIKAILQL